MVLCQNQLFCFSENCWSKVHIPDPYPPVLSWIKRELAIVGEENQNKILDGLLSFATLIGL
jgi:hypothetical protein